MAEIKLRAERRAGEILQELPREQGARTDLTSPHVEAKSSEYKTTLINAEIPKATAERWQTIAKIPEPVFEAHVAEITANKKELTSHSVLHQATLHKPQGPLYWAVWVFADGLRE